MLFEKLFRILGPNNTECHRLCYRNLKHQMKCSQTLCVQQTTYRNTNHNSLLLIGLLNPGFRTVVCCHAILDMIASVSSGLAPMIVIVV